MNETKLQDIILGLRNIKYQHLLSSEEELIFQEFKS